MSRLSSDLLLAGEADTARKAALQALRKSPTHVEALRVAGITTYNAGDEKRGQRLVEISSAVSWRDNPGQAWLLHNALLRGNYATAINHADALLRVSRVREEIFKIFNLAALEPKLAEPLKLHFETEPNWRLVFFATRNKMPVDQYDGFEALVKTLKTSKSPATREEMRSYVAKLFSEKQPARALAFWTELFPDDGVVIAAGQTRSLPWPQGTRTASAYPFDWNITASPAIFPIIDKLAGDDAPLLNLELDRNAKGEIASKNIMLSSGQVTLAVADKDKGPTFSDALAWSLQCLNGGARIYMKHSAQAIDMWTANLGGNCSVYKLAMEVKRGGIDRTQRLRLGAVKLSVS